MTAVLPKLVGFLILCIVWVGCVSAQAPQATIESQVSPGAKLAAEDALVRAAMVGDQTTMRRLIDQGVEVNASGSGETYPLFHAVDFGSPEAIELLLDAGARTRFPEFGDGSVLHMAALGREGRRIPLVLETLIRRGESVDAVDGGGRTPLHLSALYGRAHWAESLLRYGADVNALDAHGATPTDYVRRARSDAASSIKALLSRAGGVLGSNYEPLDLTRCPEQWQNLMKGMWRLEINAAIGANLIVDESLEEFYEGANRYAIHSDGRGVALDSKQRLVGVHCRTP